ncbi:MAG: hypothetical protein GY761_14095 [Hyphomicrobiales bacterium]|nr:hypothetical protein [Hyphomicrobiales bacterium]
MKLNRYLVMLASIIARFWPSYHGSIATTVGIMIVPIMASISVAIDYSMAQQMRSRLQEISDGAALAAASELGLSGSNQNTIEEIARNYAISHDRDLKVSVTIYNETSEVQVDLSKHWKPLLIQYIDKQSFPAKASARASKNGSSNLCILTLNETARASLAIEKNGKVSASNCSIQSNSTSSKGIVVEAQANLKALDICSSGGYLGSSNSVSPRPIVDCPVIPDPMINRSFSSKNVCHYKKIKLKGGKVTLSPGTYCGAVIADQKAEIQLRPGLYQFLNAPLIIDGGSKISGKYVTLQFSGSKSYIHLTNASTVELSAMKTGATAGILLIADKSVNPNTVFKIQSENAREFTGLLYLPNNKIEIGADTKQGDACASGGPHGPKCKHLPESCETNFGQFSDWTAIVADQIEINKGVNLVMNTDYKNSDIPVPIGVGNARGILKLTR